MQQTPTPHSGTTTAVPPRFPLSDLQAGSVVGDYVLAEQLASGGFGVIWRAESLVTGRKAAIKILHQYLVVSAEAVARLEREAMAIAAIRHPNVVEVIEYNQLADGRPYIVMELLEGRDLYSHLRERGPMAPERALEVIEGVCAALAAAHQLGIVHRDVKASNVVLSSDDPSRIVLIDFGLAKLLESQGPELTASRSTIGTPSCISPEQIRAEPVDQRTDIYALGALAYHVLTGEPPFSDGTALTIHYMHLYSRRPRPSSRVDVPPVLDEVVMKAMAKNPDDRYRTTAELVEAFAAAVRGEAVTSVRADAGLVGIYLDVGGDVDDADDALFDDLESVIGRAEKILADSGLAVASRRNNSALFVATITGDDGTEIGAAAFRVRMIGLATELIAALERRPGRDRRVEIRAVIDAVDDGADGPQKLLERTTRVALARGGGTVFATDRFVEGLDIEGEQVKDSPALVRLR